MLQMNVPENQSVKKSLILIHLGNAVIIIVELYFDVVKNMSWKKLLFLYDC
jgi:hypothetical protein